MDRTLLFVIIGYLSGSLLFAKYFGRLLSKRDVAADSPDGNPGTFNAFKYGGFACGVLTLCGDLLKGFLPVYLYLRGLGGIDEAGAGLALVVAAPVLGHILPLYHRFRGGKGIAVSFGCLLGLLPEAEPVLILAAVFLFFSLIVNVQPNWHKTFLTYLVSAVIMSLSSIPANVSLGFGLVTAMVMVKLLTNRPESSGQCEVTLAWKH